MSAQDDMVERVGLAIDEGHPYRLHYVEGRFTGGLRHAVQDSRTFRIVFRGATAGEAREELDRLRRVYLGRAAIEAMREPTEVMIEHGRAATAAFLNIEGSALTVAREKMRRRYNAMVDAALSHDAIAKLKALTPQSPA